MPFEKNNKLGFTSKNPFDKNPVCFKVLPGVKDKLKTVPDWQEQLRKFVDELIENV
ncbi:hypothetical protein IQ247_19900 [Plectonema cf. radiosum LEGE 06105]|uniref:Uncharacterized protein n=1 Tax=Plectonema cf. radiosum LEGE 06105 TaxID=945769 RepID=A0A8J7F5M5_9CYAN|nr:hypothetical protein [Plectonema radiosum]MBE9214908.1 hypothetical protein [Plectonema cf. radiosum LEGE 06105]